MSSELYYRSLKVPALKELLQKRSLIVSGKKEDMIARLLEADKSNNNKLSTLQSPRVLKDDFGDFSLPEDEIDWGDDAIDIAVKPVSFEKTPNRYISDKLVSSKKNFKQSNFQKIQKDNSDFKFTSIASAFSTSNLTNSIFVKEKHILKDNFFSKKRRNEAVFEDRQSVENEIIKRKARASRFGIPENENNKKLERCIRFGALNTM
ncbi:hypothetical protein PCANB_000872 [Pneumocystis canis]|nr:hypothetical protein PCK1_000905 [Pneumocystis canis]KAG5437440.1 hypothetical protein PCANB_000872 [Pneumocystis canis]